MPANLPASEFLFLSGAHLASPNPLHMRRVVTLLHPRNGVRCAIDVVLPPWQKESGSKY